MTRPPPLTPAAYGAIATLVLIASLHQLAVNMYAPAVPEVGRAFGVAAETGALAITMFLSGLAVSILAYGPLADHFGRRPVFLAGTLVFVAACILSAHVDTFGALLILRALQGVGAGAGLVVARAMSRDLFTGPTLLQANALINNGLGVVTGLGPLLGGLATSAVGWQGLTYLLAAFGVLVAVIGWINLPPPPPRGPSQTLSLRTLAGLMGPIIRSRTFLTYALVSSLSLATWWTFVAGAASIFVSELGRSPVGMGAAMAGVIVAYIAGGMAASMLAGVDRDRLLTGGLVVQASAALALVAAVTVVPASVLGVLLPVMVLTAAVGVVFPACTAVILDRFAERSATASAANSFVTLGIAAAISGLFGLVPLRPSFSVALIILFCCGAALLVHHLGARSLRLRAPAS